jgi:hypothetical protein
MSLVKVNYSLNKKYFVENNVFKQAVKKATLESKNVKLINYEVEVPEEKDTFSAKVVVNIKKNSSFQIAINELQENIETYSLNIIDTKPKNISIEIEGEF